MTISWNKDVQPSDFDSLLDAKYDFLIVNAETKIPKSNLGEMLSLELDVISDNAKGRKQFENWCYIHENDIVAEIANQNIKALAAACSIDNLTEEKQLIGKKFSATLKTSKCGSYQNMIKFTKTISNQMTDLSGDLKDDDIPF